MHLAAQRTTEADEACPTYHPGYSASRTGGKTHAGQASGTVGRREVAVAGETGVAESGVGVVLPEVVVMTPSLGEMIVALGTIATMNITPPETTAIRTTVKVTMVRGRTIDLTTTDIRIMEDKTMGDIRIMVLGTKTITVTAIRTMEIEIRNMVIGTKTMAIETKTMEIETLIMEIGIKTMAVGIKTMAIGIKIMEIGIKIMEIETRTITGVQTTVIVIRTIAIETVSTVTGKGQGGEVVGTGTHRMRTQETADLAATRVTAGNADLSGTRRTKQPNILRPNLSAMAMPYLVSQKT